MARPTDTDYSNLINALEDGRRQLAPDGYNCSVCGDNGHQAFECHQNPAYVMEWKSSLEKRADDLHDLLHQREHLSGWNENVDLIHELLHQIIGVDRR